MKIKGKVICNYSYKCNVAEVCSHSNAHDKKEKCNEPCEGNGATCIDAEVYLLNKNILVEGLIPSKPLNELNWVNVTIEKKENKKI